MNVRTLICLCLISFSLFADDSVKGRILLTANQDISSAIHLYRHYRVDHGDDETLLNQLALQVIQKGFKEGDESAILALFGAGISTHEATLSLFAEALRSPVPQQQLLAIHFLGLSRDRLAERLLLQSQGSPYLAIRLKGALLLAQHSNPQALEIAETLMAKAPHETKSLFPPLFAAIPGTRAKDALRRLMQHTSSDVRVSAIISAAAYQREDLLPQIRSLALHPDPRQKEACAYALGALEDETSIPLLKKLLKRPQNSIQVAAALSLHQLHDPEGKKHLMELASQGEPLAIISLSKVTGSEDLLSHIASKGDDEQKCNALLALLARDDPRCYPAITDLLASSHRDRALISLSSPAGTITTWKPLEAAYAKLANKPELREKSLQQQEKIILASLELPEPIFLKIALFLIQNQENTLIPALFHCLENHATPNAIALLKQCHQLLGAPLIRQYALLALCRLDEGEEYKRELSEWISQHHDQPLIQFRPSIVDAEGDYTLTPQETSRFLIEAYELIVQRRDAESLGILLDALENGHLKNRYVLAGFLLRALE